MLCVAVRPKNIEVSSNLTKYSRLRVFGDIGSDMIYMSWGESVASGLDKLPVGTEIQQGTIEATTAY